MTVTRVVSEPARKKLELDSGHVTFTRNKREQVPLVILLHSYSLF